MAHSTLPLSSPVEFPQPFSGEMLESLITRVNRVYVHLNQLSACQFEEEGQKFCCGKPAVVTDIKTELPYCAGHFWEVQLG